MRIDQAALDRFLNQLEHALDTMSRRQSVVASNVANIDTPGYRTRDMDFDKALAAAMDGRADGVAARARELRGLHPDNPVNLPRGGGVQLELPPRVRGTSPRSGLPDADGITPATPALIDGLAAAARAWSPPPAR